MSKYLSSTLRGDYSVLPVANGGTGLTTLTVNSVLLGNGRTSIQSVTPGAAGQVLTSDGTTWISSPTGNTLPSQTGNATKFLTTNGVSLSWSSVSSKLSTTSVKSADYAASINDLIRCDTRTAIMSISFPTNPPDGSLIGILDLYSTFGTNNVTLLAGNNTSIEGEPVYYLLDISGTYASFVYNTATTNWRLLVTPTFSQSSSTYIGYPGVLPVAYGGTGVSLSTGTGKVVLSDNPVISNLTLTAPALGTPVSGDVSNCLVNGYTPGFKEIPQVSVSANYVTVMTDSGKHILHPSADTTARTYTIAALAYPIGTAIMFINQNGAGTLTIIAAETMRIAGAGTTGNRTLVSNGLATAIKVSATEWIISGVGLL